MRYYFLNTRFKLNIYDTFLNALVPSNLRLVSRGIKTLIYFGLLFLSFGLISALRVTFLVYFDRAIFYFFQLFHGGGPYHIETSPLISRTNQWTGFYIIGTFALSSLWLFLSFIGVGIKVIHSKSHEWIVTIAGVCLFSCRIVGRWYSSR